VRLPDHHFQEVDLIAPAGEEFLEWLN